MTDIIARSLAKQSKIVVVTSTIQAALDSLPNTGGEVYVPPGVYEESVRMRKPNTRLYGTWSSIIRTPANAKQLINDCPVRVFADGCTVENLQLDGNRLSNPTIDDFDIGRWADGVGVYANHCIIRHNYIHSTIGHGVIIWNEAFTGEVPSGARHGNIIEQNKIHDGFAQRAGIDIASTSGAGTIVSYGNIIRNNFLFDRVIILHTAYDTLIEGNIIDNRLMKNQWGISVHTNSKRTIVKGNIIKGASVGIGVANSDNTTIVGNTVSDIAGTGVLINDICSNTNISCNIINVVVNGVITKGGSNVLIEGNLINNCTGNAIEQNTTASTNVSILNNKINGTAGHAISFSLITGGLIMGNDIDGGTYGVVNTSVTSSRVSIKSNKINNISIIGINTKAPNSVIEGNIIENTATDPIRVYATNITIRGNRIDTAVRGFYVDALATNCKVLDNEFYNVTNLPQLLADTITKRNIGYETEGSGAVTIPAGATYILVTHGLKRAAEYNHITVTPTNNMGNATKYWISHKATPTFRINVNVDPGADATFVWQITRD